MIGPIDRNLNVTCVEEKLGTNTSGGIDVSVPLAGATVIENVPCIHAREIIIMINTSAKIKHVYLLMYGASHTVRVDIDLGSVAAGTTALLQYLGGAGQTYDVRIEPDIAPTTVNVWTCAR